jgi:hypothetical protein
VLLAALSGVESLKLSNARVKNFKSIEDSDDFSIGNLTCLAGKNESGKTALLQALYHLNPVEETKRPLDRDMEYPRQFWAEFDTRPKDCLSTTWSIEAAEKSLLEARLGPGCLRSETLTLSLKYGEAEPEISLSLDFPKILSFLAKKFSCTEPAKKRLLAFPTTSDAIQRMEKQSDLTKGEQEVLAYLKSEGSATRQAEKILRPSIPKFIYFSTYEQLKGEVAINDLQGKIQNEQTLTTSDRVFLALLDLAGTSLDQIFYGTFGKDYYPHTRCCIQPTRHF